MKRSIGLTIGLALLAAVAVAEEGAPSQASQETVPATVEGGAHKFKEGGRQIGAGFRGIGRGIRDIFTGRRSKEDFKDAKKIGTGARDVGLGTAGVGRGVGRDIKSGFKGEGHAENKEQPPNPSQSQLREEELSE